MTTKSKGENLSRAEDLRNVIAFYEAMIAKSRAELGTIREELKGQ